MDKKDLNLVGRAYVEHGFRPVYNAREIRRGRNKGKLEVLYRSTATKWRKAILAPETITQIVTARQEGKFDYDHPCPHCGKWLFHDEISPDCPNTKRTSC